MTISIIEGNKDVVINGGTFIAQRMESNPTLRGFDLLTSKALPSAFHMADADAAHSTCHRNTRTRILQHLKDWGDRKVQSCSFIIWLHGAAGGGKTAIGRTIAKWYEENGILLGEFFFSRAHGVHDQLDSLAATLAYRMATLTLPAAKEEITQAVIRDPLVFSTSLANQMTKLVVEPLNRQAPCGIVPYVIILDGLDECLSAEEQDLVLGVLSGTLHSLNPDLRILICSRPEPTISAAFNASPLKDISTPISLSDDTDSDADIRTFLVERFAKLKKQLRYPPSGEWPTAAELDHFVEKSSGQFVFASTVVKYVSSPRHRHNAVTRLKHVLDLKLLPPNKQHPFAELDALYSLILSTREEVETTVQATAVCLEYPKYFNTISPQDLAKVLQLELSETQAILDELASLFDVGVNNIRPFHASFSDYLYDRSRSGPFHRDRGDIVLNITYAQLQHHRDPRVLSFHTLVRLLEDVSPTEGLQNILDQMDPSSIFTGDPFNGQDHNFDTYYLISLLRQLQKHVSFTVNQKLVSYFDREFASHVRGLFLKPDRLTDSEMPLLQSLTEDTDFYDDDDSLLDSDDGDLRPSHAKGKLLVQQPGEGNISDESDHHFDDGAGSRPVYSGEGSQGYHNPRSGVNSLPTIVNYSPCTLVLLCTSPAWDEVVTATSSNVEPSRWASFRSICDAASFVRSHLPKTLSALLDSSRQADAAIFCLNELKRHSTADGLVHIFSELLPHSLSHAKRSPIVTQKINYLLARKDHQSYTRLPSSTWTAMAGYISRHQSNKSYYSPHPLNSQRPSGTSRTQPSTAPRLLISQQFPTPQRPASTAQKPSTKSQPQRPPSTTQKPSQSQRPPSTAQKPSSKSQPPSSTTQKSSTNSQPQRPSSTVQKPLQSQRPPSTAQKSSTNSPTQQPFTASSASTVSPAQRRSTTSQGLSTATQTQQASNATSTPPEFQEPSTASAISPSPSGPSQASQSTPSKTQRRKRRKKK